jgi:hypothetical protein
MKLISNLLNEYVTNSKKTNFWSESPFEGLLKLGIDERGKWGENLIYSLITLYTSLDCKWDGDSNIKNEDGSVWDILIRKITTEIKTAMRGTSVATWQHEKLVNNKSWEKIIFIDVDYSGIWFTVQNYNDIPFNNDKHKLLGKKSTPCKGGWKFDLSIKQLKELENNGDTIYFDLESPNIDEFVNFIEKKFK